MTKIILATTSPYRKEAFGFLGIDFETEGSKVDESKVEMNNPKELVKQLSKLKAEAIAKNHPGAIVIGMDSVGYSNGKILEKPKSREEAFQRLKNLSGKSYEFYTGVYMVNILTRKAATKVVKSKVFMRKFSDDDIKRYLDEDPDYNKYAHGYDIKNKISSSFVSEINGSYNSALMGIPLEVLPEMLSEVGYEIDA